MAEDMLTVGNIHIYMENTAKAEACFTEALTLFRKRGNWANAASATTKLANIVANRGQMAKAIELLEESLNYLAKAPFEETEIQTRFALLQAMEFDGRDVDRAIENARRLCGSYWDKMPEGQREVVRDFVGRAVDRYMQAHPQTNVAQWKAQNFPMIRR
jgi:tetratricopeptide (TPR) repeat protein